MGCQHTWLVRSRFPNCIQSTKAKNNYYSIFGNSRVKVSGHICSFATASTPNSLLWTCLSLGWEAIHFGAEGWHLRSQGYLKVARSQARAQDWFELHWGLGAAKGQDAWMWDEPSINSSIHVWCVFPGDLWARRLSMVSQNNQAHIWVPPSQPHTFTHTHTELFVWCVLLPLSST